jgi:hypothetical protein
MRFDQVVALPQRHRLIFLATSLPGPSSPLMRKAQSR